MWNGLPQPGVNGGRQPLQSVQNCNCSRSLRTFPASHQACRYARLSSQQLYTEADGERRSTETPIKLIISAIWFALVFPQLRRVVYRYVLLSCYRSILPLIHLSRCQTTAKLLLDASEQARVDVLVRFHLTPNL